jgi:hypothetical protein
MGWNLAISNTRTKLKGGISITSCGRPYCMYNPPLKHHLRPLFPSHAPSILHFSAYAPPLSCRYEGRDERPQKALGAYGFWMARQGRIGETLSPDSNTEAAHRLFDDVEQQCCCQPYPLHLTVLTPLRTLLLFSFSSCYHFKVCVCVCVCGAQSLMATAVCHAVQAAYTVPRCAVSPLSCAARHSCYP